MSETYSQILRLAALVLAVISLGACSSAVDYFARVMGDEAAIDQADSAIDALLARDKAAMHGVTHPEVVHLFSDDVVGQMFDYLPAEPERRRSLLQYNWSDFHTLGGEPSRRVDLIYRIEFEPDEAGAARSEFVRVGLFASGDMALAMVEMRLFPVPPPVYDGPDDWPAGFWIALILAPVTAIFCLLALISTWRTPRVKRRILWSIFIVLIGYPVFAFSSETGSWFLLSPGVHTHPAGVHYSFFDITAFSASWMQNSFTGHHVFNVAIPVGALLFFLQKFRGKLALKEPRPSPASQTGIQDGANGPST